MLWEWDWMAQSVTTRLEEDHSLWVLRLLWTYIPYNLFVSAWVSWPTIDPNITWYECVCNELPISRIETAEIFWSNKGFRLSPSFAKIFFSGLERAQFCCGTFVTSTEKMIKTDECSGNEFNNFMWKSTPQNCDILPSLILFSTTSLRPSLSWTKLCG